MKTLIMKLNLFVLGFLLFFAQTSRAQVMSVEEYRKNVANIVYAFDSLEDKSVLKEMDRLDVVAGGALTYQLAAEVAENTLAAMDLLRVIGSDKNFLPPVNEDGEVIDKKRQAEYDLKQGLTLDLIGKLGRNFARIIRHHGDDGLDPEAVKIPAWLEGMRKWGYELVNSVTDIATFPRSVDGNHTNKIKERMIREYVSQDIIIAIQHLIADIRKNNPDSPWLGAIGQELVAPYNKEEKEMAKATNGDLVTYKQITKHAQRLYGEKPDSDTGKPPTLGSAEKALMVRMARYNASHIVMGLSGVVAFWWTFGAYLHLPLGGGFDFFGKLTEGYSTYASVRWSDFLFYTGATVSIAMRQATGSWGAIDRLKNLIHIRNHKDLPPEFSQLKLPLLSRLARIQTKVDRARAIYLDPNGAPRKPSVMERLQALIPDLQSKMKFGRGAGMCASYF